MRCHEPSPTTSFLLLLVRHLFLEAWHLLLLASCYPQLKIPGEPPIADGCDWEEILSVVEASHEVPRASTLVDVG